MNAAPTRRKNRYAGLCAGCGRRVEALGGFLFEKRPGDKRWPISCKGCRKFGVPPRGRALTDPEWEAVRVGRLAADAAAKAEREKAAAERLRAQQEASQERLRRIREMFDALARQESPFEVLGLREPATVEQVKRAYRKRAMQTHPDHGGSAEEFGKVEAAYRSCMKISGGAA